MGCDIHIVLEFRERNSVEWVGAWLSDRLLQTPRIAMRDYAFFAEVAAVRGHTPTSIFPRNLPKDVSRLAWLAYMRCPTDYHSPSHATPEEFVGAWRRANPNYKDWREEFAEWDLLRIDIDHECDWRVVYWFDN